MYEYEVRGRGDFPWDMLRYDRVYPLTSPVPNHRDGEDIWRGGRTVRVRGAGCTPARWASFCWTVLNEQSVLREANTYKKLYEQARRIKRS